MHTRRQDHRYHLLKHEYLLEVRIIPPCTVKVTRVMTLSQPSGELERRATLEDVRRITELSLIRSVPHGCAALRIKLLSCRIKISNQLESFRSEPSLTSDKDSSAKQVEHISL